MDRPNRICIITDTNFRSVSHYDNPGDVLGDNRLSPGEKRAILSSWASDTYAVESNPALRELPGVRQAIRLTDILSALRELDGQFDPPRGGAAMRTSRPASSTSRAAILQDPMIAGQAGDHGLRCPADVNLCASASPTLRGKLLFQSRPSL